MPMGVGVGLPASLSVVVVLGCAGGAAMTGPPASGGSGTTGGASGGAGAVGGASGSGGSPSGTGGAPPIGVTAILAGGGVGCAVVSGALQCWFVCALVNGGVQCWGYNPLGQLGNGSQLNSSVPVRVNLL